MIKNYNYINEPLYPMIDMNKWEVELFSTIYLRRLKHLSHFGAGSLISPVVHSRFEHTIGVWKLTAIYFKEDNLSKAAAILHDIGHLPFSHAVEKNLGYNHHKITENYIRSKEIERILHKADLTPQEIIDFLNSNNQITGTNEILGLDHLDSFFRDTYMNGTIERFPGDLLKFIKCDNRGVSTDNQTAHYLMNLILEDHELFLSPELLAADCILAEAIKLHFNRVVNKEISFLTDYELLSILRNSKDPKVVHLLNLLTIYPDKIKINSNVTGEGIKFGIRKIYNKKPLCKGKPLEENDEWSRYQEKLSSLKKEYELILDS
ncbi:HD domain-containing protein [Oceanobacillus neutriphilus]|uniref:HD/PDEase domain-containing protein n=1 Tax=Oceanobacillus neutriphilus TaxID=531815 RepID=A0ABQ2NXL1_9BACI|nr:HD domain-containing protein [Oceanobacillus neutriphilus]GGP13061.1 hypothetical protein GCM10011346_31530 [Oceanobacillus neutriphilus]